MRFLDHINNPNDLKKIPKKDLPQLAQEIRETILDLVSEKGGHLGASLGAVELTIALHYIFDTPTDKLVWDTGHQAYPHKLLTGRKEQFKTIRQYQGISGFLSRAESPYDTFGAGHAGTSISAALGMAIARDQMEQKHKVIAIIGDGAMTAGMAYEALNHAGGLKRDMIVILNDNEMSISKNVGAFSSYLTRIITAPLYTKVKKETEDLLKQIPKIGSPISKAVKIAEGSVKGLLSPGSLFEELGFRYIGPIDGHQLDLLLTTFENIKHLQGPLLIHLLTKKGKGYSPAEQDQSAFHGTSAFHLSTGEAKKKSTQQTYTSVFANAIIQLARKDPRIVAITAAMPDGTGLTKFSKEFPNRFYDVGIAEQHGVTLAAGMAADGLRPFVVIYSTFLQRAFDQIVHDVALQNFPVVFCLDRAGLVGEDGPTHHGTLDIAYLKGIPNLTLMAPKDENELTRMMATALTLNGPCAIRYPRGEGVGVILDDPPLPLPIGEAEIVRGDILEKWDIAFIAIGNMVYPALSAANLLEQKGLKGERPLRVGVVNARFIKPIDQKTILAVARICPRIITLEDHVLSGGFGESVLSCIEEDNPAQSRLLRLGLKDQFITHGAPGLLRKECGLDVDSIVEKAVAFLNKQG
jgi:1-deoxy-D-xylulose-5-phosphate synthase